MSRFFNQLRSSLRSKLIEPLSPPWSLDDEDESPTSLLFWDSNAVGAGRPDGAGAWFGTNQWQNILAQNKSWSDDAIAVIGNGGSAGGAVISSSAAIKAKSLYIKAHTGTYNIGTTGNEVRLIKGIVKDSGSGLTIIFPHVKLTGANTWENKATTELKTNTQVLLTTNGYLLVLKGSGPISLGFLDPASPTTTPSIAGSGLLHKNGSGLVKISGINTGFTGDVILEGGGILQVHGDANSLGSGNRKMIDGVLEYFNGTVTMNKTLGTGQGQVQILGGNSGFGQRVGTLTIVFNNNAAYQLVWGSAYFNPSILFFNKSTSSSGTMTLSNPIDLNGVNRTIRVNSGLANINGVISGAAGLEFFGYGELFLKGMNTFTGPVIINEGTLSWNGTQGLSTQPNPLGQSSSIAANLIIRSGILNNSGLAVTCNRLMTVGSNASIYSSSSGPVVYSNTGVMAYDMPDQNATLSFGGSCTAINQFSPVINDNGFGMVQVQKIGGSVWQLNGANTYTRGTIITGGTLRITAANNIGNGNLAVGQATLSIQTTNDVVLGGAGKYFTIYSGCIATIVIAPHATSVKKFDYELLGNAGIAYNSAAIMEFSRNSPTWTGVLSFLNGTVQGSSLSGADIKLGNISVASTSTAILRPGAFGNSILRCGTLTFGNLSKLMIDSTASTMSRMICTGNVTLASGVGLILNAGITTNGVYDIITTTGNITGTPSIFQNNTGKTITIAIVGKKLQATVS